MMVKLRKLKQLVQNYNVINDVIPTLNIGGCGVFALTLADALKRKGIETEAIIIGYNGIKDINKARGIIDQIANKYKKIYLPFNLHSLADNGFTIHHIMLKIETDHGTVYIDSEGIYDHPGNSRWKLLIEGTGSIESLRELVECKEGWTSIYNRCHNPKVHKIVNNAVNQAFKEVVHEDEKELELV